MVDFSENKPQLVTSCTQTEDLDDVVRDMILKTVELPEDLVEDYMNTMTFASMHRDGLLELPLGMCDMPYASYSQGNIKVGRARRAVTWS